MTPYLFSIAAGLLMSLAWWVPGAALAVPLGWGAALALAAAIRMSDRFSVHYLTGLIWNTLGFFWLFDTIKEFGGFDAVTSALIFLLFVTLSSVQNIIFCFLYRALPAGFGLVRVPLAWTFSELVSIRIFPWHFGHTQIGFLPLVQAADLGGALLITFLMCWTAAGIVEIIFTRRVRWDAALPVGALALAIAYGFFRIEKFQTLRGTPLDVALIQANISIKDKGDIKYFEQNTARYVELTRKIARDGQMVIWPESVIQEWIHTQVGSLYADPRLPRFDKNFHLLTGALTFENQERYFNSALAIFADGTIPVPYHKRILMPFGEYMPFSEVFPFLKDINPAMAHFTPGRKIEVFQFPTTEEVQETAAVAPLICYEDVVPRLSREAVKDGAELLVNLTNDAWFGHTIAPYQHHLIASFRAIENRRYLLRSTNSGLTAIVNPLGETTSQLPIFSEGTLLSTVELLRYKTFYSYVWGDVPWWSLFGLSVAAMLFEWRRRSEAKRPTAKK